MDAVDKIKLSFIEINSELKVNKNICDLFLIVYTLIHYKYIRLIVSNISVQHGAK